jgi:ribosomal protein S18 acetylase RimI-like enzyme
VSSSESARPLGITPVAPGHVDALATFFLALADAGDVEFFHPHPFTRDEAEERCRYVGDDLYYVLGTTDRVMAYGMLRGWDKGYETPSLGLAVDPAVRGRGFGRLLLQFLHVAALWRGASSVRLTVDRENERARSLYESAGYAFAEGAGDELVGTLRLR